MIYSRPLRLTTLHFAQRRRMDDATFMITHSFVPAYSTRTAKTMIIHALTHLVQTQLHFGQDERFTLGDSDAVLKMRSQ